MTVYTPSSGMSLNNSNQNSPYTMPVINAWYHNPLAKGNRSGGNAAGQLYLHPFYSGNAVTIDQLDCVVTTVGTAGAVCRAGVYQIINQSSPFQFVPGQNWATLLYDAGTVPTDGSTGEKFFSLTPSITFPPATWFAIGGVDQVAVATRSIGNNLAGAFTPFGAAGLPVYGQPGTLSLRMDNVTGPLPSLFNVTATTFVDSGIGVRRIA